MPMHDWTRVEAGDFHAFHHEWISEISRAPNQGLLPGAYYALPEQVAAGFGPDVLTLQGESPEQSDSSHSGATTALLSTRPQTRFTAETDNDFYRRKKNSVVVRHVTGDRIVAMLEIISPGNKSNQHAMAAFVDAACELLEHRIHLLIVDPFPPGPRDPHGIHDAIWDQIEDNSIQPPTAEPLTLVAYECDLTTRAYIETLAVGQPLPDMPLFLEPNGCVMTPLERTYQDAFAATPLRSRSVLTSPTP